MKKLLLTLGAVAAVAAPVASVVACGAPAKPAPKAIDNTAATKLAGKIAAGLGAKVAPTVTPLSNGNFEFTFDITHDGTSSHGDITITPKGEVVKAKLGGQEMVGNDLDALKKQVKEATIDHSHDTTEKFTFTKGDYDNTVVNNANLTPPTNPTSSSYEDVNAFNDAVTAFRKAYKEEIAKEALAAISTDKVLTNLLKTEDQIKALGFNDRELVAADVDALGLTGTKATNLKRLITLGAKIHVTVTDAADVSGIVMGLKDDARGDFMWIRHNPDNNPFGINFATVVPAPATKVS